MYYYKQIDRETGNLLALQTCNEELQDNHETIRLEALTEEEYNQLLAEMEVNEYEYQNDTAEQHE